MTSDRPVRRLSSALAIGRPPEHDLRTLMDAILYVDRTGVPWHYLPHSAFDAVGDEGETLVGPVVRGLMGARPRDVSVQGHRRRRDDLRLVGPPIRCLIAHTCGPAAPRELIVSRRPTSPRLLADLAAEPLTGAPLSTSL
ncbi:transposase [Actinomadura nitritigenes]|uniref:transposase n=1 Tax=Actinomadura nitritigenes TaxID=134602 RepID=UPI003D8A0FBB